MSRRRWRRRKGPARRRAEVSHEQLQRRRTLRSDVKYQSTRSRWAMAVASCKVRWVPSASPFSKSSPSTARVLVTCADADHRGVSGGSKGVEGRGLHFDGVDAGSFSVCDRRRCFAEGSVGGPGRAEEDGLVEVVEPVAELVQQYRVEVGPLRGWEVMRLVPSSRRALSMIMKYGGSPSATTRPAEVMEMISAHPDAASCSAISTA